MMNCKLIVTLILVGIWTQHSLAKTCQSPDTQTQLQTQSESTQKTEQENPDIARHLLSPPDDIEAVFNIMAKMASNLEEATLAAEAAKLTVQSSDAKSAVAEILRVIRSMENGKFAKLPNANSLLESNSIELELLTRQAEFHHHLIDSDFGLVLEYIGILEQLLDYAPKSKTRTLVLSRLAIVSSAYAPGRVPGLLKELKESHAKFPLVESRLIIEFCTASSSLEPGDAQFTRFAEIADEAEQLGKFWVASCIFRPQVTCYLKSKQRNSLLAMKEPTQKLADASRSQLVSLRWAFGFSRGLCQVKAYSEAVDLLLGVISDTDAEKADPMVMINIYKQLQHAAKNSGREQEVEEFRDKEVGYDELVKMRRELRRQELDLRKRLTEYKSRIDDRKKELEGVLKEIREGEARILEGEARLREGENQIELQVKEIETNASEIAELEQGIAAAKARSRLLRGLLIAFVALTALSIALIVIYRRLRNTTTELAESRHDVNELNMKLARMRRMDSLGLMAGSIAHDFNNILVGVSGNAELIDYAQKQGEFNEQFVLDRVKAIRDSADRAQQLSKQMLRYAGKQYVAQKTIDLNQLILGYESVMRSFSRDKNRISLQLDDDEIISKVDETQIEQAIFNLVTNAINASESGGVIKIRTFYTDIDDSAVLEDPFLFGSRKSGGRFCCVEIQDHGVGMPAHQIDKIFEPYYSESGQGRGLGLAVVYGIVECHEGLIRCTSSYGKGTTFQVLLPACDKCDEDSIDAYLPENPVEISPVFAGRKFLVIDDEESVLDLCTQFLHQFDLKSQAVHVRGENAIDEILSALNEDHFDGILIDVVMPELNGTQILDILKEKQFEIPIIIMSGFSPERLDFYHRRFNVKAIMPKPFGIPELANAIQRAIPVELVSARSSREAIKPPKFQQRRSQQKDPS